jgi:hypothetical protein
MFTTAGVPGQPLAEGVTVYCTVPCVLPLALVSACAITAPLPGAEPFVFTAETDQLYVVPLTVFGLLKEMFVVPLLQIVWDAGVACTVGIGLTFTVTVCTGLKQLLASALTE